MTILSTKSLSKALAMVVFSGATALLSTTSILAQSPITDPDASQDSSPYYTSVEGGQETTANTDGVQLREEEIR